MNVAELKRELQTLGVSTATPGLFGDERLEELRARWELAVKKQSSSSSHLSEQGEGTNSTDSRSNPQQEARERTNEVSAALPSVESLSIGELRSRLADLGLSSATPGLAGEQRHQALVRRLVEAICGQEQPQREVNPAALQGDKPPVGRSRRPPMDPPPEPTPVFETASDIVQPSDPADTDMQLGEGQEDISVAQSELNELKKQIKRISNKRSIYIASKFSGPQQDSALKSMSTALQDIEADIATCKGTSQRGERKIRSEMLRSRSSSEMKTSIFIDDALVQLESRRDDLKEQIRVRRAEIKQEAEDNPEFGVEAEERLRQQMSQAAMTNSKVSRARKRFADMKTLDEAIVSATDGSHEADLQTSELDALKNSKNEQIAKKEESLHIVDAFPSSSSSTSRAKVDRLSGSRIDDDVSARDSRKQESKDQQVEQTIVKTDVSSGVMIEDNPQRVKERMGLHRLPAPKGPPPKQAQTQLKRDNNEDKDDSEDNDSSDDDDDDEDSSEEEDDASETESESGNGKARALSASRSFSSDIIEKNKINSSLSTSGKSKQSIDVQDSATLESSPINNNAQICPEQIAPPVSNANDDSVDERMDHVIQLKTLREHARTLEKLDDFMAAEVLHERALELDPMDIQTLQGFAVFLHTKKGELARAEAFFNRALQLCLPSLFSQLHDPNRKMMTVEDTLSNSSKENNQPPNPKELASKEERFPLKSVVNLLLAFGSFLEKSKGDAEAAALLLQKAVRLAPENAFALASFAHFFTLHRGVCKNLTTKDTESMFRKALKLEPKNANYMMWYGKFLKKTKKLVPAELMYRSAVEVSKDDPTVEPSTLCNYATFLFKYRKNTEKAEEIFTEALQRFPEHKGLRKNYAHLMKSIAKRDEKKEGDSETRKIVSTPVVPRTATAHSASRGSKRAHRLTHSIVTEMPDMESTASKAEFILSRLGLQDETNAPTLSPIVKKLEFAEEEDFTEINPAMMQAKASSFRDSLSPTKSFRGAHPSLKYFDEEEEDGASDKY